MSDLPDLRLLSELDLGVEAPAEERIAASRRGEVCPKLHVEEIRFLLSKAACTTVDDVVKLGCTGFYNFTTIDGSVSIDLLRQGLTGVGGLPCYVPSDRYCLAHKTIGGLQKSQAGRYQENVPAISRDLRPEERAHVELVNAVRENVEGDDRKKRTRDILSGKRSALAKLGEVTGDEIVLDSGETISPAVRAEPVEPVPIGTFAMAEQAIAENERRVLAHAWLCPEHDDVSWACRYCVAQEIVQGSYMPDFLVVYDSSGDNTDQIKDGKELEPKVAELNGLGVDKCAAFVRVATWERKLSR